MSTAGSCTITASQAGNATYAAAAISQIVAVFNHHLTLKVTPGGLIQMWYRLQAILFAWYLEIQAQALDSAVLHGDETGWRVNGKTHWLWCFTTTDLTYFMIDRSRGSPRPAPGAASSWGRRQTFSPASPGRPATARLG